MILFVAYTEFLFLFIYVLYKYETQPFILCFRRH